MQSGAPQFMGYELSIEAEEAYAYALDDLAE
jgi:hypothetical protein